MGSYQIPNLLAVWIGVSASRVPGCSGCVFQSVKKKHESCFVAERTLIWLSGKGVPCFFRFVGVIVRWMCTFVFARAGLGSRVFVCFCATTPGEQHVYNSRVLRRLGTRLSAFLILPVALGQQLYAFSHPVAPGNIFEIHCHLPLCA